MYILCRVGFGMVIPGWDEAIAEMNLGKSMQTIYTTYINKYTSLSLTKFIPLLHARREKDHCITARASIWLSGGWWYDYSSSQLLNSALLIKLSYS